MCSRTLYALLKASTQIAPWRAAAGSPPRLSDAEQKQPPSADPPERQRASDTSRLLRLQAATERIRHLESDNRELRDALARALGEQRTSAILGTRSRRDTPNKTSSKLIGPC